MRFYRTNPVFSAICFVCMIVYFIVRIAFFCPEQIISCVENGQCTVYRKEGKLRPQFKQRSFNPKEIKSYKCISHYISKKHGGYYVYSLLLRMNDESVIDLDTFRYRDKGQCKELMLKIWNNKTFEEKNSGAYML